MLPVAAFCVLALCVPFSQGDEFKGDTDEMRGKAFIRFLNGGNLKYTAL